MVLDFGGGEALESFFHAVSEDAYYSENFGSRLTQRFDHLDATAAGGDQVFNHNHLASFLKATFDAVIAAMVLG